MIIVTSNSRIIQVNHPAASDDDSLDADPGSVAAAGSVPLSLHPEFAAFVARIVVDPRDDVPRLVFADWLDEHDAPKMAEFIRLQVEIAGHPPLRHYHWGGREKCRRCQFGLDKLGRREEKLFGELSLSSALGLGVPWFEDLTAALPAVSIVLPREYRRSRHGRPHVACVRRGFPEMLRTSITLLVGAACDACHPMAQARRPNPPARKECKTCHGTNRVGSVAKALFRRYPLLAVSVAGVPYGHPSPACTPELYRTGEYYWTRVPRADGLLPLEADIPEELFDRLAGFTHKNTNDPYNHAYYPTVKLACAALDAAAFSFGRDDAGLPALTGPAAAG